MAQAHIINSFGFMPYGDRVHDPLLYEIAQCGAQADIEAACNTSIIATCNATLGDSSNPCYTHEQLVGTPHARVPRWTGRICPSGIL
ncbi:hypothetical protein CYMTET_23943 [Cymbomonas tetramitiformis]|uniref:Uncharacterized protein n=1 Tax=Cymbomonas tetramitiformis TaxID=36881 RepID=A0AAE0FXD3_9CHLO|nr:hypothetical protein CYMTET_23943 [Cymbomonas tetramitiformis]